MKKNYLLLFIFSCIMFSSCEKNDESDVENTYNEDVNNQSFKLLTRMSTGEIQTSLDPDALALIINYATEKQMFDEVSKLQNTYSLKTGQIKDKAIPTYKKALKDTKSNKKRYLPTYRSHVGGKGWLPYVNVGEITGTTGQSRRIEALMFKDFPTIPTPIDVRGVRVHLKGIGWTSYQYPADNIVIGTTGQSRKMEAIQFDMFDSALDNDNRIYALHRAYVQDLGWLPWTLAINVAGTAGQHKRMEAYQLELYY